MATEFIYQPPTNDRASGAPCCARHEFGAGDWIGAARIYTGDLPRGVPTELFHPYLDRGKGQYAITVEIAVGSSDIILLGAGATWGRTPSSSPEYTLHNVRFPRGIPMTLTHGGEEYPGILRPV